MIATLTLRTNLTSSIAHKERALLYAFTAALQLLWQLRNRCKLCINWSSWDYLGYLFLHNSPSFWEAGQLFLSFRNKRELQQNMRVVRANLCMLRTAAIHAVCVRKPMLRAAAEHESCVCKPMLQAEMSGLTVSCCRIVDFVLVEQGPPYKVQIQRWTTTRLTFQLLLWSSTIESYTVTSNIADCGITSNIADCGISSLPQTWAFVFRLCQAPEINI